MLVIRGYGGGPVGTVCESLSKIAEIVLVNIYTAQAPWRPTMKMPAGQLRAEAN